MKTFLHYLGAIIVLVGVICLACYYFFLPTNYMLVIGLALELIGLVAFVLLNKFIA